MKMILKLSLLILLVSISILTCGRNEIRDKRVTKSKTQATTPKAPAAASVLPPLEVFNVALPYNFDYQNSFLYLKDAAFDPLKVLKEVRALKTHIDLVNNLFEQTRIEFSKIHHQIITGELIPFMTQPTLIYITEFDPMTHIQSRLTIEGNGTNSTSWKLEIKRRMEEYFVPIFAGRMDTLNEFTRNCSFIFKHRHEDAPNITPLDVFFNFSITNYLPTAPVEYSNIPPAIIPSGTGVAGSNNNDKASLVPGVYEWEEGKLRVLPLMQYAELVKTTAPNSNSNNLQGLVHTEMSSNIYGQIYSQKKSSTKVEYKPVNVKWVLRRNLTMNSGYLSLDKTTLNMGDSKTIFKAAKKEASYRFTWQANGAGQIERYATDVNQVVGAALPTPLSTVCWSPELKKESCIASQQIVDNSNSNNQ